MKLSTRAEYGIRVLVALAHADGERPTSLAGIAKADKLPHAYIEQLVGALRRAGLVTATRGHAGGYRLARPAEQISLVDAVRALDGPILEMPCAGPNDLESCDRPQDCSVHEVFERLQSSLSGTLGATTLAEVAAGNGGPPYPPAVRRRHAAAAHAKSASATSAAAPS
jgi:Rrf2 family transcriptional regulator, cysteine metabolism repressor